MDAKGELYLLPQRHRQRHSDRPILGEEYPLEAVASLVFRLPVVADSEAIVALQSIRQHPDIEFRHHEKLLEKESHNSASLATFPAGRKRNHRDRDRFHVERSVGECDGFSGSSGLPS